MVESRSGVDDIRAASREFFVVGEHVDCLDTVNKWCNAEVLQTDAANGRVFVHYTGFASKYDEWVDVGPGSDCSGGRIQKQWRRGANFQINNRIDVLDQMGKWLPASIVEIHNGVDGKQIAVKVHFVGFKAKWDEVIQLDEVGARRIREIGAFSKSHGWARYN